MKQSKNNYGETFFCFSPAVMLATFAVEVLLALYVFIRYHLSPVSQRVIAILVLLGAFQGAEYLVCAHAQSYPWPQLGFVAITFLPVLTLDLLRMVLGRKKEWLFPYCIAGAFSLAFILIPQSITASFCTNSYAVFYLPRFFDNAYFVYYFGFLFWGIGIALQNLLSGKPAKDKDKKSAVFWLLVGYASFLLPTGVLALLLAQTHEAIPSIMCGFAVFFAFILVFGVIPRAGKEKKL